MTPGTGNQHASRKRWLLGRLAFARYLLRVGFPRYAANELAVFWRDLADVPLSTRRRWRCGR